MSSLHIEVLDPIKLALVSRLYKAYYPSGKAKKDELIIVGYSDNQLTSVVRFQKCRAILVINRDVSGA